MPEFETWWLLALPLFFGLGWFAARYDARQSGNAAQRKGLPDAYFRGLNFLLNEQSDQAVDAFIDVVRLDPETIELHFALGNLFRRRGETDRAIRVHQNLVERADLDPSQREQALFELGQDFWKAGLLDRAETCFQRLEHGRFALPSLQYRLEVSQAVRDWAQAIGLAQRLQDESGTSQARVIAHFYCEQAVQRLESGGAAHREDVRGLMQQAVRADPGHPRPWLLLGELAMREDRPAVAIDAWRNVEQSDAVWLTLVAPAWLAAFEALGQGSEGLAALEQVQRAHPSVDIFSALLDARVARDGPAATVHWAGQTLRDSPSLLGLDRLLQLQAELPDDGRRGSIELAREVIRPHARRLSRYVCSNCGFKAVHFYWHCPGCNHWDSYEPRRSEELERG